MKNRLIWLFLFFYLFSDSLCIRSYAISSVVNSFDDKDAASCHVYKVTSEGAWCWFADPRALHYENKEGTINKTYIGYIDIHGAIKAMQYDFITKKQEEILIRSHFQPDDHNNPTFLILPDERVMIFYSRHTDEACFYYRVSRIPGDVTTLGAEKKIETAHNTTYPSPFILSDDPKNIYLCWRGIGWHPTIAKISVPDQEDNVEIVWGPHQIVKSTGARPYAKYASNGIDKIYFTYTTGHPDNESPNYLYFNSIDIHLLQVKDIKGTLLSTLTERPFEVNKTEGYATQYPYTLVDRSSERDWVWQVASDQKGNPVIAMVRISNDKKSHNYYYAKWNGREWKKTFLANAGGHFHQTPDLERCYSAGMAIDPANTNQIYCSLPVEGKYGKVYEIVKFTLNEESEVVSTEATTKDSPHNNIRPYLIPASEHTPLRLVWMQGDYYDWIVSSVYPKGFSTGICADFKGFPEIKKNKRVKPTKPLTFHPDKAFAMEQTIHLNPATYQGCLLQLGELEYYLNGQTLKPEVRYKGQVFASENVLGTSDCWKKGTRSTAGEWYAPQKYETIQLKLIYEKGVLCVYINGLLDQKLTIK